MYNTYNSFLYCSLSLSLSLTHSHSLSHTHTHPPLLPNLSHTHSIQIDSGDEELEPPPSYRANMDRRRKSVFAESYEPGEDDSAVEKVSSFVLLACC